MTVETKALHALWAFVIAKCADVVLAGSASASALRNLADAAAV